MREPAFWWREPGLASRMLAPVAAAYGVVARARLRQRGQRVAVPVVCIGNFTVGGAGKTPTALATARILKRASEVPVFLTRGYGGSLAGPVEVDLARNNAEQVGDEPLLLANAAPTIVARARVAGAAAALAKGASAIVMDDGFQNPALHKDICLLVIDERRGIGNGRVLPAGPLRAPLAAQLGRAHAIVLVGPPSRGSEVGACAQKRGLPVFRAHVQPDPEFIAALGRGRVLAFAGIGDPEKFFATLADAGIAVAVTRSFPDHHVYTPAEAHALCDDADREGLVLVTTEKDVVRLRARADLAQLAAQAHALRISVAFEEEDAFQSFLLERLAAARTSQMRYSINAGSAGSGDGKRRP
jgi:tetraacyldisaccharide 4'-kinase